MEETLSTDEVWRIVNEILAEYGLPAAKGGMGGKDRSLEHEAVGDLG